MRLVLQRVHEAAVRVDGEVVGQIAQGVLALVGVGHASTPADAAWLAAKTEGLRIFGDDSGAQNASLSEVGGAVLAVSQFTLYADVRKGRRPSYLGALGGEPAAALYRAYCDALTVPCERGVFGAHVDIAAHCDGPVTICVAREGGAHAGFGPE